MAASSLASKRHLVSKPIRSVTLPAASSFFSTNAIPLYDSILLSKPLRPVRPVTLPSDSSFFSANTVPLHDTIDRDFDDHRFPDLRVLYVSNPFSTGSSPTQAQEMMTQSMSSPVASSIRQKLKAKQTADGLLLHVDMPGLGKEDVKVSVEQDTLTVKGEGKKEPEDDDETVRSYSSKIDLSEKLYKIKAIKAEMKNGVLKVFVPKMKEEERTDVHHVSVE